MLLLRFHTVEPSSQSQAMPRSTALSSDLARNGMELPSVNPIIALPALWQVVPILVSQHRSHHRLCSVKGLLILQLSSPASSSQRQPHRRPPSVVAGRAHPRLPAPRRPPSHSQHQAYPILPSMSPASSSQRRSHHRPPSVMADRAHPRLPASWLPSSHSQRRAYPILPSSIPTCSSQRRAHYCLPALWQVVYRGHPHHTII